MSRESRRGRGKPDAPPAHLARTALLVLGMHRSGTSAMARVLALAGAALPRDLLPPGPGNEAGHWEPARVAGLDDEILAALEAKWHSPFGPRRDGGERAVFDRFLEPARALLREEYGDALLLVLKEPRISLLADFWQEALAAEGVAGIAIIMVRDPAEVAASLAARNGLPVSQGLLLWATYMLAADRLTRDVLRIFCRYDRLLADPEGVLDRVVAATGVALPGRSPEAADATRAFLRPALHHYRSDAKDADGLEQVARLWTYYAALADGEQPDEGGMRAARLWLDDLAGLMAPILRKQEAVLADVFEAYHAEVAIHARLAAELADVPALRQQLDRLGEEAVAAAARQVADGAALDQLRAEREIRLKALVARNMEVDALRSSLRSTAEERDRLSAEAENAASALATAREQAVELEAHAARAEIASSAFADELRARKAALEQARAALSLVRDSADAARAEFAEAVRRVQDGAIAERASLRAELTAQYAARFAAEGRAAALDEALVCARDADAGARARAESVAAEAARLAAELEAARAMAAVRDAEIARLGGGLLARLRAPFASPDPAG